MMYRPTKLKPYPIWALWPLLKTPEHSAAPGDSCGDDGGVGVVQRGRRRAINPWSTGATMLWQTAASRGGPRSAESAPSRIHAHKG
jgi:hypothetical protein